MSRAYLVVNGIQQCLYNILVRCVGKATVSPGLFILLVALAQTLRPKVEGISKRLMDTIKDIPPSHEHALEGRRTGSWVRGHENRLTRHNGSCNDKNLGRSTGANWWMKKGKKSKQDQEQKGQDNKNRKLVPLLTLKYLTTYLPTYHILLRLTSSAASQLFRAHLAPRKPRAHVNSGRYIHTIRQ